MAKVVGKKEVVATVYNTHRKEMMVTKSQLPLCIGASYMAHRNEVSYNSLQLSI